MTCAATSSLHAPRRQIETISPTLPKGGGALTGLGDVSAQSDAFGTAGFTVALPVSKKRLAPDIRLHYSSAQGNGHFGLGMALSIPCIQRMTRRGIPRYDDKDEFSFDGERLLPDPAGDSNREGEQVLCYRMERDEACSNVERHTRPGSEPVDYWVVHARDGSRHIFGRTHQARLQDPAAPTHIAQWSLEETVNAVGEHVCYLYKNDPGDPGAAHALCIKRVRYGNRTADAASWAIAQIDPATQSWMFELLLDYGEHPDDAASGPSYDERKPWNQRPDYFSRFEFGFEVRCDRLCERALLFHNFEELASQHVPVSALDFSYASSPQLSLMTDLRLHGYGETHGGAAPSHLSYPPLTLQYTPFLAQDACFRSFDSEFPGLNAGAYQVVDLYADGIPGLLYSEGDSLIYRRARTVGPSTNGLEIAYEPAQTLGIPAGGVQGAALMDLTGDGRLDVLRREGGLAGCFSRDGEDGWRPFASFETVPTELIHPDGRFVDLTGDGLPDLAVIRPRAVRFYRNRGPSGFAEPQEVGFEGPTPLPTRSDPQSLCTFADFFGSGQQHLLKVSYRQATCWPNLGHGRFGVPHSVAVPMAASITAENFDPARLLVADIDGSGAVDILYLGETELQLYMSQCGKGFDEARIVPLPKGFRSTDMDQISCVDLFGNGTSVVVMSRLCGRPEHWVCDFSAGVKPYLLRESNDNMGEKIRWTYTSSAHEWLAERMETPGARGALPMPVPVVHSLERIDEINGLALRQVSKYRHAYYCVAERRFQGFGLVVREEAEDAAAAPSRYVMRAASESTPPFSAPMRLKTWYHTGAPTADRIQDAYAGDPNAEVMPLSRFENSQEQTIEASDALHNALRGRLLREEVYGLDQPDAPYKVSMYRHCVRQLWPTNGASRAAMLPYELESLRYDYERDAADPRCEQKINLVVDAYASSRRSVTIHAPRRAGAPAAGSSAFDDHDPQQQTQLCLEELCDIKHIARPEEAGWRLGIPIEIMQRAVVGLPLPPKGCYHYEDLSPGGGPLQGCATQISSWCRYYYADPTTGLPLPYADATCEALLSQVRSAELTREQLHQAMSGLQPAPPIDAQTLERALVDEARFERLDDCFWSPGLRASFKPREAFFAVASHEDPFGAQTRYVYDASNLFVTEIVDALGNLTRIDYDYRVLEPKAVIDPNEKHSTVRFDALGRVSLSSYSGSEPARDGGIASPVGFGPLANYTSSARSVADALHDPRGAVHNAACAIFYECNSWMGVLQTTDWVEHGLSRQGADALVAMLVRQGMLTAEGFIESRLRALPLKSLVDLYGAPEGRLLHEAISQTARVPVHVALLRPDRYYSDGAPAETQIRIELDYMDGFGRSLQTKRKAEPGDSYIVDADEQVVCDEEGKPVYRHSDERWQITGRLVYGSHAAPVRQYEPYYLNSPLYLEDPALDQMLSSETLWRDALGRVVEVVTGSGHLRRNVHRPWRVEEWDENDTLDAADSPQAQIHQATPGIKVLDARSRTIRQVACQRSVAGDELKALVTHLQRDASGHCVAMTDPRFFEQRKHDAQAPVNEASVYSITGQTLRRTSCDAGWRVQLADCRGLPWRSYDQRGQSWHWEHDALGRPTAQYVAQGTAEPRCVQRCLYGESPEIEAPAKALNLRGRLWRHYDSGGLREIVGYGLRGAILIESRRFLQDATQPAHWTADLDTSHEALEPEVHTTRFRQDALGGAVEMVDAKGHQRRWAYHLSGRLAFAWLRLSNQPEQLVLSRLAYGADDQRRLERHGNGVQVASTYEPKTRRLSRSVSTREADGHLLQDLRFRYDPVGNVLGTANAAEPTLHFRNERVSAEREFAYDTLYQLIRANGREHASAGMEDAGIPPALIPPAGNAEALVNYTRTFQYDLSGNLTLTRHQGAQNYSLDMVVSSHSNRAVRSTEGLTPGDVEGSFDAHGNLRELAAGQPLSWNAHDRLECAIQVQRPGALNDFECYGYGGDGRRIRRYCSRQAARVVHTLDVRYLPGLELRHDTARAEQLEVVTIECDGSSSLRVLHWEAGRPDDIADNQFRYALSDPLGSTLTELDGEATVLTSEEFYPYGGTAVWIAGNEANASYKHVRYSGKERDATGLYDYGLRSYAPWLCRWISPDPAGVADGLNLFRMVRNNPMSTFDATGLVGESMQSAKVIGVKAVLHERKPLQRPLRPSNRLAAASGHAEAAAPASSATAAGEPARVGSEGGESPSADSPGSSGGASTTHRKWGMTDLAMRSMGKVKFVPTGSVAKKIYAAAKIETARTAQETADTILRRYIATNFVRNQGVPEAWVEGYVSGFDLTQPLDIVTIPAGTELYQYQAPGATQGNWYTTSRLAAPDSLGINSVSQVQSEGTVAPRVVSRFRTVANVAMLAGASAAIRDSWSVPAQGVLAPGGGFQLFSMERIAFEREEHGPGP